MCIDVVGLSNIRRCVIRNSFLDIVRCHADHDDDDYSLSSPNSFSQAILFEVGCTSHSRKVIEESKHTGAGADER